MRLMSFLCLWHLFYFSCQQFCPSAVCCWIWLVCLCWNRPFLLLSSLQDQAEQRLAIIWALGGVHGSQSSDVWCHWRKLFPSWYPRAISSWEIEKFVLKERVQARLQDVSRRFRELCVVNCCHEVRHRPRVELLLPSRFGWWRQSCPLATIWDVAWWTASDMRGEGLRDGGLKVGVSVVCPKAVAAGMDFN